METLSLCNWFKFKVGVTLEMHFLSTPIKLSLSLTISLMFPNTIGLYFEILSQNVIDFY